MIQQYRHPATGQVFAIPSRGSVTVARQQVGPHTSEAALLAMGCEKYTPPPATASDPDPAIFRADKLTFLRILDHLGLYDTVMPALRANPRLYEHLFAAPYISELDSTFKEALPAMAVLAGVSELEALELLKETQAEIAL